MNPLKIQDSVLRDFLLEVNLIEPDGTIDSRNFSADDLSPWYDVLQSSIDHDQVMVFLFPTNNKKTDQWLVAGREKYPLQRAFQQVMRFVVPTYALYQGNTPKLIQFDPQNGKAQLLANNLFCGAYTLYAKRDERLKILKRISKWYTVLKFKKIPVALTQGQPTYQKLRFSFEKALAGQDWKSAEQYLLEIQSNNLTTADNLIFLRYQLLSQQSEWKKLWTHREYNQVAEIYVPRDVKRAMLTAFHVTELMQLEANHQFDEALDRFNGLRLKLGSLLTTRQSLKAPQILRVFAYQAASEQNHNALITLKEETQDQLTHTLIDTLYQMFEPPEIILEDVPSEIRKALINSDYDTAWTLSDRLQDWIEQMYMRLQIAVLSGHTEYATISLQEFNGLYPEEQSKLMDLYQALDVYLITIKHLVPQVEQDIGDWETWFTVFDTTDEATLNHSLNVLCDQIAETNWDSEQIKGIVDPLYTLWLETKASTTSLFKQAVEYLMHYFLQEPEFPRNDYIYGELYEIFYGVLNDWAKNLSNAKLWIRLAQARLTHNLDHLDAVLSDFEDWFTNPSKDRIEIFQESIDLLANYGAKPNQFTQYIESWIEFVLQDVISLDFLEWCVWEMYAKWAYAGLHLLRGIREKIEKAQSADEDVIAGLKPIRIAIFTLDQIAAERAKKLLLERNPDLDIRINSDKKSTGEAEALAKNSDIVVIVTTCITHSLMYSISPYIDEPIYPVSRGTTSIVRAIENHVIM